ncbi:MAG: T9SS type A sorting domain-containing protein [Cytophagales bacterium]|nr:T9SS type A sorting domain-containing protein [Cytophagales bacterium]
MKNFSFFLLLSLSLSVFADFHIRYNQAGYHLQQTKEIVVLSDENMQGKNWTVTKDDTTILSGQLSQSIVGKGDYVPTDFSYIIDLSSIDTEGNYTFLLESKKVTIKVADYAYRSFIFDLLYSFRIRRSGSAGAVEHKISHLGDSSCTIYERVGTDNTDWTLNNDLGTVNMQGGWYDAGDYIKFTLTTAYSAYFMLKSYETDPELFNTRYWSTSEYSDILDEAKHGLDYLMKTYPNENTFIIQVGGYQDHIVGYRLPENDGLDGYREAYHSFSKTQMGYTAAALALGANMFKDKNSELSEQYKNQAIAIFAKAESVGIDYAYWQGNDTTASIPRDDNGNPIYPLPAPNVEGTGSELYYADKTSADNMGLAAMELYRLTNDDVYLTKAISYANTAGGAYWKSWAGVNMNLNAGLYNDNTASANTLGYELDYFIGLANKNENLWKLPHTTTWGTLNSYMGVANSMAEYKQKSGNDKYDVIFVNVMDYVLGKNNWGISFLATEDLSYTASSSYAAIYKVNGNFPRGEMSSGPTTLETMAEQGFTGEKSPETPFNTPQTTFFNDEDNYVTMESTITGQADALYLFTLATNTLSTTPLVTNSITDSITSQIQLYPNPTTGNTTLQLNASELSTVFIIDALGKEILSFDNQKSQIVLPTNELEDGVYFVQVVTGGLQKTLKFVKK